MATPIATNLAAIWADATPLARFVEERAKRRRREITSTVESLTRSIMDGTYLASDRKTVRAATIKDLIAERVVAIGRPSDSYAFKRINHSFWIDADIDWGNGSASLDRKTMVDIRIVRSPSKNDKSAPASSATPERAVNDPETGVRQTKAKRPGKKSRRKKSGGRHATHPEIRQAFQREWDQNPSFRNWPIKRMVPAVRASILGEGQNNVEASGYRSTSMARVIGQELAANRKRIKPNKLNKPRTP